MNRDSVVLNKANRDSVKYSRGGIKWEIQSQVDAHDLLLIHHSQKSRAASTKAQRHYQPEEYNDSLEMNIEDQQNNSFHFIDNNFENQIQNDDVNNIEIFDNEMDQ